MGIKSSKTKNPERVIEPKEKEMDLSDVSLRPKTLQDYVGQDLLKKHLSVSIASAKLRKASSLFVSFIIIGFSSYKNIVLW